MGYDPGTSSGRKSLASTIAQRAAHAETRAPDFAATSWITTAAVANLGLDNRLQSALALELADPDVTYEAASTKALERVYGPARKNRGGPATMAGTPRSTRVRELADRIAAVKAVHGDDAYRIAQTATGRVRDGSGIARFLDDALNDGQDAKAAAASALTATTGPATPGWRSVRRWRRMPGRA